MDNNFYLKKMTLIGNLAILQAPTVYSSIASSIKEAQDDGVDIMELEINNFIYTFHALDVSVILPYIETLCRLVNYYRIEFEDIVGEIFESVPDKSSEIISFILNSGIFACIFNNINTTFNVLLNNEDCMEKFNSYGGEYCTEIISGLNNTFATCTHIYLNSLLQTNLPIKNKIYMNIMKNITIQYNTVYEILEGIMVPFY